MRSPVLSEGSQVVPIGGSRLAVLHQVDDPLVVLAGVLLAEAVHDELRAVDAVVVFRDRFNIEIRIGRAIFAAARLFDLNGGRLVFANDHFELFAGRILKAIDVGGANGKAEGIAA